MAKLFGAALLLATFVAQGEPRGDQDLRESIVSGGVQRSYRLFVPEGAGRNGPAPVVVLFNGSGSPVESLMNHWKTVARKDGVVLVGPGALKPGAWWIPEDSPDFTHEVVEAIGARWPIDRRRVYLFGHSGGAGHVLMLALLESEYFAAVAGHAGVLTADATEFLEMPKRKIPFAIWIGTKDPLVPLRMARDTYDALMARGFPVKLTEVKGHTHSYTERAEEVTAKAWEFLRKQRLAHDQTYEHYRFNPRR